MRRIFLIFGLLLITGCSTDDSNTDQDPQEYTYQIILEPLEYTDAGVHLNWSILENMNFRSYEILRSESPNNEDYLNLGTIINKDKTDFIDTEVPYSPSVKYKIRGSMENSSPIESNIRDYNRADILLLGNQVDQVFPKFEKNWLYLVSRKGAISILDINSRSIINSLELNARIGFVDIKNYNGSLELYVPREDGWVYIYNAESFELLDRIDTGRASSSVIFNQNKLFISTDAWTNRPLKVYNRATGDILEETGDFDLTRLRKVPGSNTEIFEITLNIAPVDQDLYRFDNNGELIEHLDDRYHGDFDLDANIFSFFPQNDKFITGRQGAIYSKDMIYQSRLPQGYLQFSSFSFNTDKNLIYAGCSNEKSVQKFEMNELSREGFIKTNSYPQFIFKKDHRLLIIGRSSNTNQASFVYEETNL